MSIGISDKKDIELSIEPYVYKSNKMMSARYRMTAVEQKLFAGCLSKLSTKSDFSKNLTITATTKELKHWINRQDSGFYGTLKIACSGLVSCIFQIELDNDTGFKIYNLAKSCSYENGIFTISFNEEVKDLLLDFKKDYTKYSINSIRKMKSLYSIRIYELLKKSAFLIGADNTPIKLPSFEINEFKLAIGLVPIDASVEKNAYLEYAKKKPDAKKVVEKANANTYERWDNFKRRILEPAKAELFKNADICFDYEPIKAGKGAKVIGLDIRIWRNESNICVDDRFESDDFEIISSIRAILNNEDVTDSECIAINNAANGDLNIVKMAYDYTKQCDYENFVAYLISAINNGYYNKAQKKERFFQEAPLPYSKHTSYDIEKIKAKINDFDNIIL